MLTVDCILCAIQHDLLLEQQRYGRGGVAQGSSETPLLAPPSPLSNTPITPDSAPLPASSCATGSTPSSAVVGVNTTPGKTPRVPVFVMPAAATVVKRDGKQSPADGGGDSPTVMKEAEDEGRGLTHHQPRNQARAHDARNPNNAKGSSSSSPFQGSVQQPCTADVRNASPQTARGSGSVGIGGARGEAGGGLSSPRRLSARNNEVSPALARQRQPQPQPGPQPEPEPEPEEANDDMVEAGTDPGTGPGNGDGGTRGATKASTEGKLEEKVDIRWFCHDGKACGGFGCCGGERGGKGRGGGGIHGFVLTCPLHQCWPRCLGSLGEGAWCFCLACGFIVSCRDCVRVTCSRLSPLDDTACSLLRPCTSSCPF